MQYVSTRSRSQVSSPEAVLRGLAPDGGLYMPLSFPEPFDPSALTGLSFTEMASRIFALFLDDFEEIPALAARAYRGKFDCPDVTPLRKAGRRYILELFHGPTCAFKDVALSVLPHLMTAAMRQTGRSEEIMILTATSGDTGKAAMEGFRDVPGIRITVFYPHGGVSPVQEKQMTSQAGGNVRAAAIRGNFDDAQTAVKEIFTKGLPAGTGTVLSSANSINIGRLVPQIVYYYKAYSDLLAAGAVSPGSPVDFTVPTGNFGDILAGFFAKKLGLPVGRLICASNANNVLTDFLRTGLYDRNRPFYKTTSPSMDILVSSNLERLLYMIGSEDCGLVRELMDSLRTSGSFRIPAPMRESIQEHFSAGFAGDAAAARAIADVWEKERILIDPHTAVAWAVADQLPDTGRPNVILSTASPYKFPAAVLNALGQEAAADPFGLMDQLSRLTGTPVPKPLASLKSAPVRFTDVVRKEDLYDYVVSLTAGNRPPDGVSVTG